MEDSYLKYRFNELIEFNVKEKEFITLLGNNNDLIIKTLLYTIKKGNIFIGDLELNNNNLNTIRRKISFVLYKHLNIFVGETVMDEIAFSLESLAIKKDDIINLITTESRNFNIDHLLDKDPNSLGASDKVKMKIVSSLLIKPKILVLDNIISELDYEDKIKVVDMLKEFVKYGGIVINFTNVIEESLFGNRIIIVNDKKLLCDGKTMSVLNEEKLLKRIGIGMPFIIELSKYLMDYGVINKYYTNNKSLVGAIWK